MQEEEDYECCTKAGLSRKALAKPANNYDVKSNVPPYNPKLRVDLIDIEDLGKKVEDEGVCVLCRCFKSKAFPYCDGSHNAHNEETGDNAGPIVIVKKGG